jgi:phage baseplate assembly protein W
MSKKQYINIRYPFTAQDDEHYFVDLDSDSQRAMRNDILHVIFTPKGQRIRMPEFGTNLIKFIFEPNDNDNWSDIKDEIKRAVSLFVPNVILDDINVYNKQGEESGVYVQIKYSVDEGAFIRTDTIITKI